MARRIATEIIHSQVLWSFIACRLIPVSKNPGVRPIGICETLRRIIGKVIMKIVGPVRRRNISALCGAKVRV